MQFTRLLNGFILEYVSSISVITVLDHRGAKLIKYILSLSYKVWTIKNNTNFNSIFCLIKCSKLILFFYLHFAWLCGSWQHQRIFKKWPFWKNHSWFSSKESKLTSVKYPWNYAFSCMENSIFNIIAPLVVIVLTKCGL
jgi:hypothetical protein